VCFEYFALLIVAVSGLLARWVWPHEPHAGTVLLAGWGTALLLLGAVLLSGRQRRGTAKGKCDDILVLGGEAAKSSLTADALRPKRVQIAETVIQVMSGEEFTLARTASGEVWSWGAGGESNALGHGSMEQKVTPEKMTALKRHVVTQLAAGSGHAAAVTADGALFTFGDGSSGQLGHGDDQEQLAPKQVAAAGWAGRHVISVTCCAKHTATIMQDGSLFTFGDGGSGQLGHGDAKPQLMPKLVEAAVWAGRRVVAVACGKIHTAVIMDDKSLFTFGRGDYGNLGHGDKKPQLAPKQVNVDAAGWGGRGGVTAVACGNYHTVTVVNDGSVFTFGHGGFGQLGHGDTEQQWVPKKVEVVGWAGLRIVTVACGEYHTAAVSDDGSLFTFGKGGAGRLGHGDEEEQLAPKQVEAMGLWGRVVTVACSDTNTAAVMEDGSLITFGAGESGQLGHYDYDGQQLAQMDVIGRAWGRRHVVAVACSESMTAAVVDDGSLFTFGYGGWGQLGHGDKADQLAPKQVEAVNLAARRVIAVACGMYHTAAVSDDGSLFTFGKEALGGGWGRLGHGEKADQLTPKQVDTATWAGRRVVAVACGSGHTAAVMDDGSLFTFGGGCSGPLGHGD
jgi:alpha-tubulin suppressor-like RCC1 family protein